MTRTTSTKLLSDLTMRTDGPSLPDGPVSGEVIESRRYSDERVAHAPPAIDGGRPLHIVFLQKLRHGPSLLDIHNVTNFPNALLLMHFITMYRI